MHKAAALFCLMISASVAASAFVVSAPEIAADSAVSALALLGGALLIYRGRRKK